MWFENQFRGNKLILIGRTSNVKELASMLGYRAGIYPLDTQVYNLPLGALHRTRVWDEARRCQRRLTV